MIVDWFAIKVAFCNAVGFTLCVAGITYVDARLTTHVVYKARDYTYGHQAAFIGGISICAITYILLTRDFPWHVKTWLPSLIVLLAGAICLPFFKPELPHGGILLWTTIIAVVSLLTCFIRLSPLETHWLTDIGIAEAALIERIKEYANLWRMIAASSVFGTIALVIPWSEFNWKMPNHLVDSVKAPHEAFLLGQFGAGGMAVICIYAMVGVVYELFYKANAAADLLLLIKK